MARLTIAEAARLTGVARGTLYRAIADGRLTREPDGYLDTAELLRAGFVFKETQESVQYKPAAEHDETVGSVQYSSTSTAEQIAHLERLIDVMERERETWQQTLQEVKQELQDTKTREARLLTMLEEEQRQRQRLLEAGKPGPPRWWHMLWARRRREL